jgi:endogenous inhibitor of DNA gyrase (YacG/DUF329 family)
LIDLDNWLSERYRIPAATEDSAEGEPEPDGPEAAAAEEPRG